VKCRDSQGVANRATTTVYVNILTSDEIEEPLARFSNAYDSSLILLLSLADARDLGHCKQHLISGCIIALTGSSYMAIISYIVIAFRNERSIILTSYPQSHYRNNGQLLCGV
jgi:hypothetical protein